MDNLLKFYINGEWVEPVSDEIMPVLNPASAQQTRYEAAFRAAGWDVLSLSRAACGARTCMSYASVSVSHCGRNADRFADADAGDVEIVDVGRAANRLVRMVRSTVQVGRRGRRPHLRRRGTRD